MDWQHCFSNGNLQQYVEECWNLILDLETVNINLPNEILTFSLLGKLGGDPKLYQLVEGLTLNKDVIQRPDIIRSRIQDYVKLTKIKEPSRDLNASALVSTTNEPYKIIYYCTNGKLDAFSQFLLIKKGMENHHDRTLKKLVSDRGGEFLNVNFNDLSRDCGFKHVFAPPETPQHNGFAERAN
ncbi:hypothetical protein O181_063521 [Austropuccinia psidii MF-1]|uniref:Integrase catalytic domain-containing protein n=1 Tax=Austropuccinia psidii MF-1 TaxID=1389203 RepID=A0A9Q3ERY1_9BASI|nr:hypothetical protein [Austropuccinia psidii MF-1]